MAKKNEMQAEVPAVEEKVIPVEVKNPKGLDQADSAPVKETVSSEALAELVELEVLPSTEGWENLTPEQAEHLKALAKEVDEETALGKEIVERRKTNQKLLGLKEVMKRIAGDLVDATK